jgi:hypothetical protein
MIVETYLRYSLTTLHILADGPADAVGAVPLRGSVDGARGRSRGLGPVQEAVQSGEDPLL